MKKLKALFTRKNAVRAALVTTAVAAPALAVAGTGGLAGFDGTFDTIVATAEGTGGKIITACAIAWGIFQIVKQNWIQVIGALLGALILSELGNIVNGLFSATVSSGMTL